MVILKLSFSRLLHIILFFSSSLRAEIIPFFNPTTTYKANIIYINSQNFLANDFISLKSFFDDWSGEYNPQDGDNYMLEEYRVDIGIHLPQNYYIGYFYSKHNFTKGSREFVDFYHTIKTKKEVDNQTSHNLQLELDGLASHGMILAKNFTLIDNTNHLLNIGISGYLSFSTDIQKGYITGKGSIFPEKEYNISGYIDYYYQNNLLYDLEVVDTYGLGYGIDLALFYANREFEFDIQIIANNLFAKTYWKNLPYSSVDIDTNNAQINKNGDTEYNPTISGYEFYRDYTYSIKPRYHIDIKKYLKNDIDFSLGVEYLSEIFLPYISISKKLEENRKVTLTYEHKFKSVGVKYQNENYSFRLFSNGLLETSVLGLSLSYSYHF